MTDFDLVVLGGGPGGQFGPVQRHRLGGRDRDDRVRLRRHAVAPCHQPGIAEPHPAEAGLAAGQE